MPSDWPVARREVRSSVVLAVTVALAIASASCSGTSSGGGGSGASGGSKDAGGAQSEEDSGNGGVATVEAGGPITETGILVDYETLSPVPGLTVTDNGVSTTTDASGAFSLTVPANVTTIAPMVTGTNYTQLYFPTLMPIGGVVQCGTSVIPDSSTYALEQQVLANDQTKALVQVVVHVSGACASAVGGTLQVLSPAGTSLRYFGTVPVPETTITSFQDVSSPRPVAVIYDIPVGAELTVAVTHPTCTLTPFPATVGGEIVTGQVTTKATEPGDANAALVLMLQ